MNRSVIWKDWIPVCKAEVTVRLSLLKGDRLSHILWLLNISQPNLTWRYTMTSWCISHKNSWLLFSSSRRSEGFNPQQTAVFHILSMLNLSLPNSVWWCSRKSQRFVLTFLFMLSSRSRSHREFKSCVSWSIFPPDLLNSLLPKLVCCCVITERCRAKNNWVVWNPKPGSLRYVFWTTERVHHKLGTLAVSLLTDLWLTCDWLIDSGYVSSNLPANVVIRAKEKSSNHKQKPIHCSRYTALYVLRGLEKNKVKWIEKAENLRSRIPGSRWSMQSFILTHSGCNRRSHW